jgi:biotin synthase
VSWPHFESGKILERLCRAASSGLIRRVCLQVVNSPDVLEKTESWIRVLGREASLPVCVSISPLGPDGTARLFSAGAERISFPLDAAAPGIFRKVKGGDYSACLRGLIGAARRHPGRIMTHLIAGLGESEEELIGLIVELAEKNIGTGLFAFTPVRGTPMQNAPAPEISSYRRVQLAHFLARSGAFRDFEFSGGRLRLEAVPEHLRSPGALGEAFRTSGCPDCNRPYYNERPGGPWYNFPRPMTPDEIREALREAAMKKCIAGVSVPSAAAGP